jgi:exodeoxyribonuclease VII small subunit
MGVSAMPKTKIQNFEESLARLEEIVALMERPDLDLDKSLSLFEEGIKLVRFCTAKLNETKKEVEILIKDGSKISVEHFKANDEK